MKKIRTLNADEIEVRPQQARDGKAVMLLYIDSRAATDLLDETYGMENWNFEFKEVSGKVYGRLSIYDEETKRWVYREDTGEEANISKDKSLASDIYKRCVVRFGVCELYSAPRITIQDDGYGNTGLKVSEISYDEQRNITHLVVVNKFDKEVFSWNKGKEVQKRESHSTKVEVSAPSQKFQDYKCGLENTKFMSDTDGMISKEYVPNPEGIDKNSKILKDFCTGKKTEAGVDIKSLTKFFQFYVTKTPTWTGTFQADKLWTSWAAKERRA